MIRYLNWLSTLPKEVEMQRDSDELVFHIGLFRIQAKGRNAICAIRWPLTVMVVTFTVMFFMS